MSSWRPTLRRENTGTPPALGSSEPTPAPLTNPSYQGTSQVSIAGCTHLLVSALITLNTTLLACCLIQQILLRVSWSHAELPVLTGSLCSGGCNDWRRSARANPLLLTVLLLRMINLLLYIMIRHGLSWTPVLSKILQTALPCVSVVLSLMHRLKFRR